MLNMLIKKYKNLILAVIFVGIMIFSIGYQHFQYIETFVSESVNETDLSLNPAFSKSELYQFIPEQIRNGHRDPTNEEAMIIANDFMLLNAEDTKMDLTVINDLELTELGMLIYATYIANVKSILRPGNLSSENKFLKLKNKLNNKYSILREKAILAPIATDEVVGDTQFRQVDSHKKVEQNMYQFQKDTEVIPFYSIDNAKKGSYQSYNSVYSIKL